MRIQSTCVLHGKVAATPSTVYRTGDPAGATEYRVDHITYAVIIEKKPLVVISGPAGSGKSELLKLFMAVVGKEKTRVVAPTQGARRVCQKNVDEQPASDARGASSGTQRSVDKTGRRFTFNTSRVSQTPTSVRPPAPSGGAPGFDATACEDATA